MLFTGKSCSFFVLWIFSSPSSSLYPFLLHMASKEVGEDITSRGNEWEVVSLTASAYAAAPGPDGVDFHDDNKDAPVGEDEAEASHALIMSSHFVFPPSKHENLPLELITKETQSKQEVDDTSLFTQTEESVTDEMGEPDMDTEKLKFSNEFPKILTFDEKGNVLSVSGTEFEDDAVLDGSSSSLENMDKLNIIEKSSVKNESTENVLNRKTAKSEDKYKGVCPCHSWWKKGAASLIAHAKETNTFWSICIAAAVMGLVVLTKRWQQERWKVLQFQWQSSTDDEMMGSMFSESHLKGVAANGGDRQGSFIRGSASTHR